MIKRSAAWLVALLVCAVLYGAAGTVHGRFWLNAHRLCRLTHALAATPAIESMSLGTDDRSTTGRGEADFDSYRFINGTLVTHYPGQARPGAEQPIIFVDDELSRLGVPRVRYDELRRLMTRSRIDFIRRDPASGQMDFGFAGHNNEWDVFLVYIPGQGNPGDASLPAWGSLAPHWFWAERR